MTLPSPSSDTASPLSLSRGDALWLLGLLVLASIHLALYARPFEDAFITYRYAENLAAGDGLVFNPGELVEGCTSLSWTLLLGLLAWLGLDLPSWGPALSSLTALGVVYLTVHFARTSLKTSLPGAVAAGTMVALSGTWAYFGASGMETCGFAAALVGSAIVLCGERPRRGMWAGMWAGLAATLRPEGAGYAGVLGIAMISGRDSRKHALPFTAGFAAIFVPLLAFRLLYYGEWLPNTYYAKAGDTAVMFDTGLGHLSEFAVSRGYVLVLPFIGWACWRRRDQLAFRVVGWVHIGAMVNVLLVGADTFLFYRFLLPVLPFGAAVMMASAGREWDVGAPPLGLWVRRVGAAAAMAFMALGSHVVMSPWSSAKMSDYDSAARLERFADDYRALGIWLDRVMPEDGSIALNAVGILPYYAKRPTIDMLGLTDATVAKEGSYDPTGAVGHSRHHAHYVISRNPAVLIPALPATRPRPIGPRQANAWFMRHSQNIPGDRALLQRPEIGQRYRMVNAPVGPNRWFAFLLRKDVELVRSPAP